MQNHLMIATITEGKGVTVTACMLDLGTAGALTGCGCATESCAGRCHADLGLRV